MTMVNKLYYTLIATIGILSIAACNKDKIHNNEPEASEGFRIFAPCIETKTVNNGLSTVWESGDRLSVYYAVSGTTDYQDAGRFNIQDINTGLATPHDASKVIPLDGNISYDWYVYYRFSANVKPAGATSQLIGKFEAQTQVGNNSMTHIANYQGFPLYGTTKNIPGTEYPTIQMKNVASLIEYNITNSLDKDITIISIKLTSTEDLVGYCTVNYEDEPYVTSINASKTAILKVTDGAPIAKGESACFYAGIFPCTIPAESPLTVTVSVSSSDGTTCEQTFSLTSAESISFRSGKIKTLNLDFSQAF